MIAERLSHACWGKNKYVFLYHKSSISEEDETIDSCFYDLPLTPSKKLLSKCCRQLGWEKRLPFLSVNCKSMPEFDRVRLLFDVDTSANCVFLGLLVVWLDRGRESSGIVNEPPLTKEICFGDRRTRFDSAKQNFARAPFQMLTPLTTR